MKNFSIAIRSMTAYGEAMSSSPSWACQVIIQSVNRRFLEVICNLPSSMVCFESELRKWVSGFINRGQVNVTLVMKRGDENQPIVPNVKLAKDIKHGWDQIAKELGISSDFSLSLLAQEKDLFSYQDVPRTIASSLLQEVMMQALKAHQSMREEEGRVLLADIMARLKLIDRNIEAIDILKEQVVLKNIEKMKKKLTELFDGDVDERVFKEAAILSEKVDITEEIVRFRALFTEFENALNKPLDLHDTKGKKLEFFLQELSREVNTMGSKASSIDVAKHVVDIKSELEKIREQVQNIE